MITIRTKSGDTIEIREQALWPDTDNEDHCAFFCRFITDIRMTGFLLLPHVYIPAESIAMITRDTRREIEETGKAVFN